jgi:two-component system chemotaxis response regulator CheY
MKKPRILIVDDSKPILCLLEVILGKKFDVFAANDGFSAMNWLMEGNRPDIIISDLQMPNIDGIELLSYLSNSRYYDGVPVIILSGADEDEIVKKCGKVRIADYITKPFDPADLLEKINKALMKKEEGQFPKGSFLLS